MYLQPYTRADTLVTTNVRKSYKKNNDSKGKCNVSLIHIARYYELLISKALTYDTCKHGIT